MVTFLIGNIFEESADVLVNPVNSEGVMGVGLALSFKRRFPAMYAVYRVACLHGGVRLGKMHVWEDTSGLTIINFPTKRRRKESSRIEWIEMGLFDLRARLQTMIAACAPDRLVVALPALGCGLGGLSLDFVRPLMERILANLDADIRVMLGRS